MSLPLEAEDFLTWLAAERGRSPNTIAAYRRDLNVYWAWLGEQGVGLDQVGPDDLSRYIAHLRGTGRADSSVTRAFVAVRTMHRFLAEEGMAATDPSGQVESPRVPRGLPKALAEDEIERLLETVVGEGPLVLRDRAILEVLYGTGVRISELVGLSLSDIDLDVGDRSGTMRVLGKGSRERVVPVGGMATDALTAWLGVGGRPEVSPEQWARRGDQEAVFLNARGGRLTRQGAWMIVGKHARRAGLGDRMSPHVLRHSCATHMLDHGADIRVVQELLGHVSITTTQIYTKVSSRRLREVYQQAHPRARVAC